MKKFKILVFFAALAILGACTKEMVTVVPNSDGVQTLSFSSEDELARYAESISDEYETLPTKARDKNGFWSLWDEEQAQFLSTLTRTDLLKAKKEGLVFEPEDSIIPNPTFAKILNPKREVIVGGKTYRFVETGVIIYGPKVRGEVIDNLDPKRYADMPEDTEIHVGPGIDFTRIEYVEPISFEFNRGGSQSQVKPGLNKRGELVLEGGDVVPATNVHIVEYAEGNGDANGFQKKLSSLFGTSVVATAYFDSSHRMKLRTFSQKFLVFSEVGMTVRMQQKFLGIWWRKVPQDGRYGWQGLELKYKYTGPSFPSGVDLQKAGVVFQDMPSLYDQPVTLFNVPAANIPEEGQSIIAWRDDFIKQNKSKINAWLDNNPSFKNNPYGVFAPDSENSYTTVIPAKEFIMDEGKEEKIWDFRCHVQIGFMFGSSVQLSDFKFESDEKADIRRGQIYAAVRYNNMWQACVIVAE